MSTTSDNHLVDNPQAVPALPRGSWRLLLGADIKRRLILTRLYESEDIAVAAWVAALDLPEQGNAEIAYLVTAFRDSILGQVLN